MRRVGGSLRLTRRVQRSLHFGSTSADAAELADAAVVVAAVVPRIAPLHILLRRTFFDDDDDEAPLAAATVVPLLSLSGGVRKCMLCLLSLRFIVAQRRRVPLPPRVNGPRKDTLATGFKSALLDTAAAHKLSAVKVNIAERSSSRPAQSPAPSSGSMLVVVFGPAAQSHTAPQQVYCVQLLLGQNAIDSENTNKDTIGTGHGGAYDRSNYYNAHIRRTRLRGETRLLLAPSFRGAESFVIFGPRTIYLPRIIWHQGQAHNARPAQIFARALLLLLLPCRAVPCVRL